MIHRIIIVALVVFSSTISKAQILSIDKIDTTNYTKKAIWEGILSSGLEIDQQKATLYDASNYFDMSLQKQKELLIFSASERFTYNGPQDFLNTGYVHLRWRNDFKKRLHPETYFQYSWDTKLGLVHRLVAGSNIRYTIGLNPNHGITIATGCFFETERWNYAAVVDSSKIPSKPKDVNQDKFKSNSYIKWTGKLTETSNLTVAVFYQARWNDIFNPRIAAAVSLDADLSKHFGISLKYATQYDATPIVPINHIYYSLSNNITYKF